MAATGQVFANVNSMTDLRSEFSAIRRNIFECKSQPDLMELYKRAVYLITLTQTPAWQEKFGSDAARLRRVGEEEFRRTAHELNRRAAAIGIESDFDETWGK
jgi:hypothetical protein